MSKKVESKFTSETFEKYLKVINGDAKKVLLVVSPNHWADFAKSVLSMSEQDGELKTAAENLDILLSPAGPDYFADPVSVADAFGVDLATAENVYTAIVKECRKKDFDPKRPAKDQKICLYSKKDPNKLLGRHPSEEAARKQERAIHVNKKGSSQCTAGKVIVIYPVGSKKKAHLYNKFNNLITDLASGGKYPSFEDSGSGSSFSERDLDFTFGDYGDTDAFAEEVENLAAKMRLKDVDVQVLEDEFGDAYASAKVSKRVAAKQKIASLLKQGFALPTLKAKGASWVPDLNDTKTRRAFVKWIKAYGIEPKTLQFVLSNQKIKTGAGRWTHVGPSLKRGPKGKPDSERGALEVLKDNGVDVSSDVQAVIDPQVTGVWLIIDHGNKVAHIVYNFDNDFETVDYDEAVRRHGRERGW